MALRPSLTTGLPLSRMKVIHHSHLQLSLKIRRCQKRNREFFGKTKRSIFFRRKPFKINNLRSRMALNELDENWTLGRDANKSLHWDRQD